MASSVSAVSGCVANGHPTVPHVSCAPSKIPYGGFSPVRLNAYYGLIRASGALPPAYFLRPATRSRPIYAIP
jgi:hypothetical protein